MKPYWQDRDDLARLYHGDVRSVLAQLPAKSVQCVITSPPYWGLRDYGVDGQIGSEPSPDCGTQGQAQCGKCFVCVMVAVFRKVRRVLRDDGTLWLNLGDTYSSISKGSGGTEKSGLYRDGRSEESRARTARNAVKRQLSASQAAKLDIDIPSGNLVGVPWRVALALQTDGWILRQDIIWAKKSCMPESVQNRCTKSHEYVFLLTKGMGYYYDAEAIKEHDAAHKPKPKYQQRKKYNARLRNGFLNTVGDPVVTHDDEVLANKRSVWTLANEPYHGAHYATFPSLLVEPMILAGSSQKGCCPHCQTPWQRHTEEIQVKRPRPNDYTKRTGEPGTGNSCANSVAGTKVRTLGWRPSCDCEDHQPVPCIILDPFAGSATTLAVAVAQGRRGWGIELNDKYLDENAIPRVKSALALIR